MCRWLLLLLMCGTAAAAEPVPQDTRAGCPSPPPSEATTDAVTSALPVAPPALNATESAPPPAEPRQRLRTRGPAWHSFLPGIFK